MNFHFFCPPNTIYFPVFCYIIYCSTAKNKYILLRKPRFCCFLQFTGWKIYPYSPNSKQLSSKFSNFRKSNSIAFSLLTGMHLPTFLRLVFCRKKLWANQKLFFRKTIMSYEHSEMISIESFGEMILHICIFSCLRNISRTQRNPIIVCLLNI